MKLTAILAATVLAAGGGAYGLYTYSDLFDEKPADLSQYPVAKSGGCPYCNRGAPSDACEAKTDTCCANPCAKCTPVCDGCPLCEFDCSVCCGGTASVAAAGPVALFKPTAQAKASCCPNGPCCPDGPCCGI